MKPLLISINAKYIHTNNAVRLLKVNTSFDVDILEYTIKDDLEAILTEIKAYNPSVIGFSVYIWNVERIKTLLSDDYFKQATVILGGPEVGYDALHFLALSSVDFIIKGEGEIAFHQLLKSIDQNTTFKHINNLAYYDENNKLIDNPIIEIQDLSTLKLPYYLKEDIPHIKNKVAYIESGRGCPYNCSFCLSSLEKTVRFFKAGDVKQAIRYLMDQGATTIKFLDRSFNVSTQTLNILNYIIENDNNSTVFQFEITGDVLDPAIIEHLNTHARKGLFRFEIGIQSLNKTTNILTGRSQNNQRLIQNIHTIKSAGKIHLHLDLIAGLPQQSLTQFKKTFNTVFKLGAKELQLGFLKLLRGTALRKKADKFGYKFDKHAPYQIKETNDLSPDDLETIHLVEQMLEIYHNKGLFGKHLTHYLRDKSDPFSYFYAFGCFFKEHNYSTLRYQLEDIYHAIMAYEDSNAFDYLVLKDYLLRSKIKPKRIWSYRISKDEKSALFNTLSNTYNESINDLYKHSTIIKNDTSYFIVIYQNMVPRSYEIRGGVNNA
ncbi:MAG: B12-binding domain-containing radical SAM protein [Candidatus Izimaplasma sp.]|nr:B12-binding domain-containing radical SAM protein [Candidatus Izimaplasma bacterium]